MINFNKNIFIIIACLVLLNACSGPEINQLNSRPDSAFLNQADTLFLKGDYSKAINCYMQFVNECPTGIYRAEAFYRIGLCYLNINNPEEAAVALNKAKSMSGNSSLLVSVHFALGDSYRMLHKFDDAVSLYRNALKNNNGEIQVDKTYYYIGLCLLRLAKWDEGRNELNKIPQQFPDSAYLKKVKYLDSLKDCFVIQFGVFSSLQGAKKLKAQIAINNVYIDEITIDERKLYCVKYGHFTDYIDALNFLDSLKQNNIDGVVLP